MNHSICQILRRLISTFALLFVFASHSVWSAGIMLENAWSLPLPPVSKNGAAYLTIQNHGQADLLLGATSDIAEEVQLHTVVSADGQMKMQQLETVEVPMHGTVTFEPGGMHVMLLGLKEPLEDGKHYMITLNFQNAGMVEAMVMVKADAQMQGSGIMSGDHSEHSGSME